MAVGGFAEAEASDRLVGGADGPAGRCDVFGLSRRSAPDPQACFRARTRARVEAGGSMSDQSQAGQQGLRTERSERLRSQAAAWKVKEGDASQSQAKGVARSRTEGWWS